MRKRYGRERKVDKAEEGLEPQTRKWKELRSS
jgi:hypothetical protein